MLANKRIEKIVPFLTALTVLVCFLAMAFGEQIAEAVGGTGVSMEYETRLFDTSEVIKLDIQIDEDTWNEMLSNAMTEEYYACDVVINGSHITNVAIRPKGNSSLSSIVADPDSDRYSLKLEFDHFVEGQTCFGLDKLILNNNYADATNMKEAIIYDMFQYLGADAALYNYAEVSVNGEYVGVYLALEGVEQSFMLRNFGTRDGELYKPENMGMGGGNFNPGQMQERGEDFAPPEMPEGGENFTPPEMPEGGENFALPEMPEGGEERNFDFARMGGGEGGFFRAGGGSDLNYTDDDPDSYSAIWDGEVTGTGDGDHKRVITALKMISEGTNLEEYLDVDNVLKYMAVHTFAVNQDSLSGSMAHNYYLYEYNGQLNLFPWDYNLSFGGMTMGREGTATSMINDPIDTPFEGTHFFDALLENEEYLDRYHMYLQMLVDEYVNGGRFEEVYQRIRSQIDSLVATDPTAFYDYESYESAAGMLYDTVKLRGESISGQLDGSIPSTDEGQKQDSSALIDASSINISAMGQFNRGGNREGGWDQERANGFGQEMMRAGGFGPGRDAGTSDKKMQNMIWLGVSFAIMLTALLAGMFYRRRKKK